MKMTELPNDLFELSLSDEELYIELQRYYAHSLGEKKIRVKDKYLVAKQVSANERDVVNVPSGIFIYDSEGVIRGIDVIVFAYLCYVSYKEKANIIKINVSEIARKTGIRRTQIKISLNNLEREEFVLPSYKNGYFLIVELEYPDLLDDIIKSI